MIHWILRISISTVILFSITDVFGQDTGVFSDQLEIREGYVLLDSTEYRRIVALNQQAQVQIDNQTLMLNQVEQRFFVLVIGFIVLFTITTILIVFVFRSRKAKKTIEAQNLELSRKQKALAHTQVELKKTLRIAQDSTKSLRKYNRKLKSIQTQLIHAEKMSSLGQLTAGIVHEINNPVNFVKGGIELIDKNLQTIAELIGEKQKATNLKDEAKIFELQSELEAELQYMQEFIPQVLKDILFGTSRISEIVNGLRIFSRQGESNTQFSRIHDIINSSLLIMRNKYTSVAELDIQLDPEIDEIECFPGLLNQVFVNIISNAIDAVGEKGKIWVKTVDVGDWVQIEIGDDGSGIEPTVLKHIFEPFFTTKEVGKGTGIGLSITYSIIKKHGGSIDVDSSPGSGTVFKIMLRKELEKTINPVASKKPVEV